MLSKKHRILKGEFEKLFKAGKRTDSKSFFLKVTNLSPPLKNRDDFSSRFAFVTSAKVSKKAVVRNKLRRRARAIVYKLLPEAKKDVATMFFFKPGAEKLNFKEIEEEIKEALQKAGVL